MKDLEGIAPTLRQILPTLEQRYGVSSLALFGSRASGMSVETSDLDILVEFNKPIGLLAFLDLERELSNLTGLKVDLVMNSALKPDIGRRIRKEAIQVT